MNDFDKILAELDIEIDEIDLYGYDIIEQCKKLEEANIRYNLFSESELYEEIQRGSFVEATEHERLLELRTFISRLHIKTTLLGNTVSNTVPFVEMIPNDRVRVLNELDSAIKNAGEKELRRYRDSIRSL